jgi:Zn finger protein HypA/HybF involved in hydrogenase expression
VALWHGPCTAAGVILTRRGALLVALSLAGCHRETGGKQREGAALGAGTHTTAIHAAERLVSVDMGTDDTRGNPVRVRCETCHALRPEMPVPAEMSELKEFHLGLRFQHGSIECQSCHSPGQPPRLHLATGERVNTSEALRLCAQCHGPQYRDYQHGAHGGMNGSWNLAVGGRVKNHCVDCHDPHSPKPEPVLPAPRPRDRFLTNGGHK